MSGGHIPTVAELITEIRDDLDEPLDTATNFFTDTFLLRMLNRGFRQIWQTAREAKENCFVRTLRSDGDALTIYGRTYDPAQLALTAGASSLALPPDFAEALAFEAIPSEGATIASVGFEWTGVSSETFQSGRRVSSDSSAVLYAIDVQTGEGGPVLVLSPTLGDDVTSTDTVLTYVYGPKEYASTDALENSGFTRLMLDAAVAYAVLEARRKEGVPANITLALSTWNEKIGLVTRSAGPRQSQAPEVVEGFLEECW